MKKQSHVEGLADRAEFDHQAVIEAGEMLVLQRCNDRVGQRDRAGLDGVAGKLASFEKDFGKDVEGVLDVPAGGVLELGSDERVVDFVQRTRELFAVAPSPLLAADEPPDLSPGE